MFNFYLYQLDKKIVISDLPSEKVKSKFGYKFEILTSVREKESLPTVIERIKRQYSLFSIEEYFYKKRKPRSEESNKKISLAKLGKPRDEATRLKISRALKGRSNFQGKKHREDTKEVMAEKKLGNKHTEGYYWVHDPRGSKEKRVKDKKDAPVGFSLGRDYYSTEAGLYIMNHELRSSDSQELIDE
jgi:hypothetical protein